MGRFADDGLYRLLPAVIRSRDSQISGEPLRALLKRFGVQADTIESAVTASYDNFFVETCDLNHLAYIADLIGYRPIVASPTTSSPAHPPAAARQSDAHASKNCESETCPTLPTLRRDVAHTIWARRRKGTAEVLGAIVEFITGWHTAVFENNREIVATPSVRFSGSSRPQGTPDFRKLVGRNRVDQGPGLVPRVATVRRIDTAGASGRWYPLDVVVAAWTQRAKRACAEIPCKTTGDFPLGSDGQFVTLFAPADLARECTGTIDSARAMRLSDFVGAPARRAEAVAEIYGHGKAICLYRIANCETSGYIDGELAIDSRYVAFARLPDSRPPGSPPSDRWIIDPERGRIRRPVGNTDAVVLLYYRACDGMIADEINRALAVRLNEHVPMEARTGVIHRPPLRKCK